jgi:SAM-dependent methyltransferase
MGRNQLMKNQLYSEQYYQSVTPGSSVSAQLVIPVVYSYIQPKSIVDVGCGAGAWLEVWQQTGINDYLGIDGKYVQKNLRIPPEKFLAADLEKKIELDRKFDLVMSLEVAEHIHGESASIFIASLCTLGDVVLFSAAIPGQGGVLHYNEQYPEYWANLFAHNGFTGYDCIRAKIWMNTQIDTCYRQNILFFVRDTVKEKYAAITSCAGQLLPLVHPQHFDEKERALQGYKRVLRTPFHAGWHFIKIFFRLFIKNKANL